MPLAACTACGAPKTSRGVVLKHRAGCPWDTSSLSRAQFLAQQAAVRSPASDGPCSPSPPPHLSPLQQLSALHAGAAAAAKDEREPTEPVDVDLAKKRRKKLKVRRITPSPPPPESRAALAKQQRKNGWVPRQQWWGTRVVRGRDGEQGNGTVAAFAFSVPSLCTVKLCVW